MQSGSCATSRAPGIPAAPLLNFRHGRPKKQARLQINAGPVGSEDAADDGAEDLSRQFELEQDARAPEKAAAARAHLDLLWKVSARGKPELCECCRGSKELECTWCHGTGAMTVGDVLYCSDGGCRPCPVCRGTGACKCEACRGTGKRAAWMKSGVPP